MIGGSTACTFANCTECNAAPRAAAGPHGDGCGWCPSFCGGAGKCMIGKTAPIFETCRADPSTGFRFRQCREENVQLAPVIGGVVSGVYPVSTFLCATLVYQNLLFPFRPARDATVFKRSGVFSAGARGSLLSVLSSALDPAPPRNDCCLLEKETL